ncbi:MAG: hypothetical protein UX88_C0030G0008 [Candidatus Woesebacteria bacterium GW2011_GWC2_47_16]|uniref:Uncharacterized protein n=3 Tax=Candidatus Woeseibacteriota TaxID=1752722 RepID=A0A0G1T3R2_9BACT|nr:MAG: hypothetical protein UX67_C0009G0013 [Candidatus Woesebacteria bacterium GW2011_GWF2_46_8]KKU63416.1 MAG: hypothetical protein UX88_C0030G0008 [Candidatus Woesebacteria bacterium GW2011_GWC2_47_16]OGM89181.1 MAG: hypothetical protein A2597_01840 [Candidatus Woesebacteria bacterium RIFOXYD1_FULL_46_19]
MKRNPIFIGFLQSLGLSAYIFLIALVIWNGEVWFGRIGNFLGPILFLSLFVVSAIICALIALAYPFIVFWDRKNTNEALKIVGFTAGWLAFFVIVFILLLTIF